MILQNMWRRAKQYNESSSPRDLDNSEIENDKREQIQNKKHKDDKIYWKTFKKDLQLNGRNTSIE